MFEGYFACYDVVPDNDTDRATAYDRCDDIFGHLVSPDTVKEIVRLREILDELLNTSSISEWDVFYTELQWDGVNILFGDGSSLELAVGTQEAVEEPQGATGAFPPINVFPQFTPQHDNKGEKRSKVEKLWMF